jgi:single-stranded-DNA-specific exonuclease
MKAVWRDASPRQAWALEQEGAHPLLARLWAARGVTHLHEVQPDWAHLLPPGDLLGSRQAAHVLAGAMTKEKKMCIVADYDCDGATACAVAIRGLRALGARHVDYLVPNRLQDGYGLTPTISERVAATGANVLITVDNGIASPDGVARAQELGLEVVITDHHLAGDELPQAQALVNPNQPGCAFQSKHLAGVGVMFYVLLALRQYLREQGVWTQATQPRLDGLLPLVALGTVADVVSLDANNRRLVAQGLQRIRQGQMPVGMRALFEVAGRSFQAATTFDLGFTLGPRINAVGRLADMRLGIAALVTDDARAAQEMAVQLDAINRERRHIETQMREEAEKTLTSLGFSSATNGAESPTSSVSQAQAARVCCVFDERFHEGVVGIVAGRLKDQYHRPTFVFARSTAPGQADCLKGSGRSIPGFHLRDALDWISKRHPGLILRFGGHAMAAGCTLKAEHLSTFEAAFEAVAQAGLNDELLKRTVWVDGPLEPAHCRVEVAELLQAQIWGQGFAAPLFCQSVQVSSQRLLADKHLGLSLRTPEGMSVQAVWFGRTEPLPPQATVLFRLSCNDWNHQKRVQWVIEGQV